MSALPSEFDGIPSSDYDPQFTADISNKMRVPDKIGPVSSKNKLDGMFDDMHRSANMCVPEKIVMIGGMEHGMRQEPKLHLEMTSYNDFEQPLCLETPPRVLKLNEVSFLDHRETPNVTQSDAMYMMAEEKMAQNGYIQTTPYKQPDTSLHHQALMATPGDHLLINDQEDDLSVLRKQVAKLSYHVVKLEDDNTSRRQRELILYPLMFGYLFVQMMKWFMSNK